VPSGKERDDRQDGNHEVHFEPLAQILTPATESLLKNENIDGIHWKPN
jgi:hypothetical protein